MTRVLLTGFEPFANQRLNSSWEVAKALHGNRIAGCQVTVYQLPCLFREAIDVLIQVIRKVNPAVVICVGQAGGRSEVSLERVAINVMDARIPDNEGIHPIDAPVVKEGPVAYWSSLPIKAILRRLHREGIPASISQTAGTYVCNALFYGLMHELDHSRRLIRGGFVHLPYLPEQTDGRQPSLSHKVMVNALKRAIQATLTHAKDIQYPGGSNH